MENCGPTKPPYFFEGFFPEDGLFFGKNWLSTFEFEDFWSNPVVGGKSLNHLKNMIYISKCIYIYIHIHCTPIESLKV